MKPLMFTQSDTTKIGRLYYTDHGDIEDRLFLAASEEEARKLAYGAKEVAAASRVRIMLENGQAKHIYVRLINLPIPNAVNGFEVYAYPCVASRPPKDQHCVFFTYAGAAE